MRILVTGGTGFIGSQVVRRLAGHPGAAVTVLSRGTDPWRLRALGAGRVEVAVGDFTDGCVGGLLRRLRPEVVVHLAMAYHTLGSSGGAAIDAVNHHGTLHLLETFLAAGGRRFVSAGTCFEYGHHDAERIEETAPCRPIYDYAVAKARAAEGVLARAAATGTEALVLRVFAPFGPLEDPKRIVPQLLEAGRTGRPLDLTPGEQVRDYVHVADVAAAFVAAAVAKALPRAQAVYNVCTAVGHSLRELAHGVERALGRGLSLGWGKVPYRPNEMMRLVGCNRRAEADLGWRPRLDLGAGLRDTASWRRADAGRHAA
jgi:nucleoside-diphosphate-sugar epimerase